MKILPSEPARLGSRIAEQKQTDDADDQNFRYAKTEHVRYSRDQG